MRRLLPPLLLLLLGLMFAPSAHSQTTIVSAVVQDKNGSVYANCHGEADFVPSPTATTQPFLSGSLFQTSIVINQCDGNGRMSVVLADNNQVSDGRPSGGQVSQWRFTICSFGTPNNPSLCFNYTTIITGTTQNISSGLTAASATLPLNIPGNINIGTVGDLAKYGFPAILVDSGLAANNIPLLNGNNALTGNETHSGTESFSGTVNDSGPLTATGSTTLSGVGKLDGNCLVDGVQNTTLATAITCAGSSGVIEVPMFAVPSFATAAIPAGVTLRFDGPSCLNNTGTLTINGPIVAPAVQIFCGTGTVALGSAVSQVHCLWFPGADVGAKCTSGYNAMTKGNHLVIDPNPAGNCYQFSTSIALTTLEKRIILDGPGAPSANAPTTCTGNPTLLDWTSTGSTQAIVIDWTCITVTGPCTVAGGGFTPSAGIRDLDLSNGLTDTNGGAGSSAIGIQIAPTNGGAGPQSFFSNLRLTGFGTAVNVVDATSSSWGMNFIFVTFAWNTTGYAQANPEERENFIGDLFLLNGRGMNINASSTQLKISHTSFDSNLTCGIDTHTTTVGVNSSLNHWENINQSGNVLYICGGDAAVSFSGDDALDDNGSGMMSAPWFTAATFTGDISVFSGGQGLSSQLFASTGPSHLDVFDNSTTPIPQASVIFCGLGTLATVISPFSGPFKCDTGVGFTDAAPTVASGFGTGANVGGPANNSKAFVVNVGTSNTGAGILTMPAAPHNWVCNAQDQTTTSASVFMTKVFATTTTSVTLRNFTDAGALGPWTDSDVLIVNCTPY